MSFYESRISYTMKKLELLAPSGDYNSFLLALHAGGDAIYLGGKRFSARKNAANFEIAEIEQAINYAHIYGKKVYLTLNTLISDEEIEDVLAFFNEVYQKNIDGIIVQDFGLLHLLKNYQLKKIGSTQLSVREVRGVKFFESFGLDRIVIARETSFDELKKIKEQTNIEIEVFAHGALCVCVSGQCLLSYFIGGRSGNRGECAQPCRKSYTLFKDGSPLAFDYHLSLKDLNLLDKVKQLQDIGITSLKLEGRMKSDDYIANVTNNYFCKINDIYKVDTLSSTFNRGFTLGHIFNTPSSLMCAHRPNNLGKLVGEVKGFKNGYLQIKLSSPLNQDDIILFSAKNEITYKVNRLYDIRGNLINSASEIAYLQIKERIAPHTLVYKVYDTQLNKSLLAIPPLKVALCVKVIAKIGEPLIIEMSDFADAICVKSKDIIQTALSAPLGEEKLRELVSKLNDTPYFISELEVELDDNAFIALKVISALKRDGVEALKKCKKKTRLLPPKIEFPTLAIPKEKKKISVKVRTLAQFELVKSLGIEEIYFNDDVLIKNYGEDIKGFHVGDHSLNCFNAYSAYGLFALGIARVCVSLELSPLDLAALCSNFIAKFKTFPNLEYVIYGKMEVMKSRYCPLMKLGQCGECKNHDYIIKNQKDQFQIVNNGDCNISLFTCTARNLIKEIDDILPYVSTLRLEFFDEDEETIKSFIKEVMNYVS